MEGKGKITDLLAEHGDAPVRCASREATNGRPHDRARARAGVEASNLIPSGDPLSGEKRCVIGKRGGDRTPRVLIDELRTRLRARRVDVSGLRHSRRNAHLNHALPPAAGLGRRGPSLGSLQIGHDAQGDRGPATADQGRAARHPRCRDLLDEEDPEEEESSRAMEPQAPVAAPLREKDPALDLHTMTEEYLTFGHRLGASTSRTPPS